jgi:hypothetical protein
MTVNPSITKFGLDENFNLQLARGQIYNHRHVFKYGFNAAVGTTDETIWLQGGAYTWPSAAAALDITSTDNVADAPAGTGALTVTLEGLDANFDEISEVVTMNGQTAVVTTNSFLRLHRMYVTTAGSGLTNAGIIYASTGSQTAGVPDVATTIRSTIGADEGQTLQALYTVPNDYTAYLTVVHASSADASNASTITLRTREEGSAFRVKERFIVFESAHDRAHDIPIKINEKTDIEVLGDAAASTTDVAASFDLILVKN